MLLAVTLVWSGDSSHAYMGWVYVTRWRVPRTQAAGSHTQVGLCTCLCICSDVVQERGGYVRVGVSVAMLYRKGGLCTCWCICINYVQARGVVYVLVYL